MFGIEICKRGDIFKLDKDDPDFDIEVSFNKGNEDFNTVISSGEAKPISDPGELHLSILSLHDGVYNLGGYTYNKYENHLKTHDSLKPMDMKDGYNLCGDGSLLSQIVDDFVLIDIYKYTGLSLADWLNITRVEQNIIKKSIDKKRSIENEINNEVVGDLKKLRDK